MKLIFSGCRTFSQRWVALGLLLMLAACASKPPLQSPQPQPGTAEKKQPQAPQSVQQSPPPAENFLQTGKASFYSSRLNGRRTASGERYDKKAMTAAHRELAFGTVVTVVNLKNGRSVQVRINDRGPHSKGRIIDLSYAAAKQLGMLGDGVAYVEISSLHTRQ